MRYNRVEGYPVYSAKTLQQPSNFFKVHRNIANFVRVYKSIYIIRKYYVPEVLNVRMNEIYKKNNYN